MTQVLNSQSHLPPSSPSSICCVPTSSNDSSSALQSQILHNNNNYCCDSCLDSLVIEEEDRDKEEDQLSLLALLITAFRKSWVGCRALREEKEGKKLGSMEIGWPTDVRHVAHVTFDRFNGFLGLPVEFEPEVPRRAPSASASVFGVSTESMQCSFDSRGNSIPTILLLMQRHLYTQGGLQAEGIFRINAENSQEEHLREQLNSGVVPDGIEVHCLAGLIKAWFRELPSGVLDPLSPEQVMQCHSEEQCVQLVRLLPPTEAALLDWAINLMADVVQEEHHNKMNARNVAMVFAPNMTQMADPLTALMYAVQVMNFLRTLIVRTLKERGVYVLEPNDVSNVDPSNDHDQHSPSQPCLEEACVENEEANQSILADEPVVPQIPLCLVEEDSMAKPSGRCSLRTYMEKPISDGSPSDVSSSGEIPTQCDSTKDCEETNTNNDLKPLRFNPLALPSMNVGQSSNSNLWRGPRNISVQPMYRVAGPTEKSRGSSNIVGRINSRVERVEAWR